MDAVPAGLAAHKVNRVARPFGHRPGYAVVPYYAHRHDVNDRITRVGIGDDYLPPNSGNAQAVAVVGDPLYHMIQQETVMRIIQTTEVKWVKAGNGPGAHGEDIAHDAAYAGSRTLIRLDG